MLLYVTKLNEMQTLFVEISDKNALNELHSLQTKKLIRIVEPNMESLALPGKELTVEELKTMINNTEKSKTISLKQAEKKWQVKKKKLQALIH